MNKLARVQAALASSTDTDTIIVAILGPAETVSMIVNANPARPADLLALAAIDIPKDRPRRDHPGTYVA